MGMGSKESKDVKGTYVYKFSSDNEKWTKVLFLIELNFLSWRRSEFLDVKTELKTHFLISLKTHLFMLHCPIN